MPLDTIQLESVLGKLHNKRLTDIYVLLSEDGSTVYIDPGLNRPWSSPNKQLAEYHAAQLSKTLPCKVYAMDYITAINSVINHPKNRPTGKS